MTSIRDTNEDHAHGHNPRRNITQEWNSGESADKPRDAQTRLLLSPEHRRDHPLLELLLKGLNNPYRPFAISFLAVKNDT